MTNPDSNQEKRGPGRPRSEKARRAILRAANRLIEEQGVSRLTVEAVARAAKVGKPTIYRYWPNAQALAMAAILAADNVLTDDETVEDPIALLRAQIMRLVRVFQSNRGRQMAILLASSDAASELSKAFRNQVILQSRTRGKALLEDAFLQRDMRKTADLEVVADMIYGPIFFRILLAHAPLDEAFASANLDLVLSGLNLSP